jgi:hypothetical protein
VGNTRRKSKTVCITSVHPHACGEHSEYYPQFVSPDGSPHYSIHSISKALRLNYSDLKDRVHKQSAPEKVKTLQAAGFIDLGCSQSHFESECNIEMQDATGLKLKISVRGKADFNLLQLAKAFIDKGV